MAIAEFFSLLFLSLAFVLISLIVKSRRTHVKIGQMAFKEIEKNISKIFTVLLISTFILIVANVAGYYSGHEAIITSVVGFIIFTAIFYMPSAIVVDGKSITRALKESIKLHSKEPQYFLIWLFSLIVIISAVDLIVMALTGGAIFSSYIVLVIVSLFVLPYFVIFQAEAYMNKFKLLKH